MTTVAASTTEVLNPAGSSASRGLSLLCIIAWPLAGLACVQNLSGLDTFNIAGLALAILISQVFLRGERGYGTPLGRVWTALTYLLAVLLLSPAFMQGVMFGFDGLLVPSDLAAKLKPWISLPHFFIIAAAYLAAPIAAITLWVAMPCSERMSYVKLLSGTPEMTAAQRLELAMQSGRTRINLLIFLTLLIPLSYTKALGLRPFEAIPPELVLLPFALLALRPLLQHAAHAPTGRAMTWSAATALAIAAAFGVTRYVKGFSLADEMGGLLKAGKVEDASQVRAQADALNAVLKSSALNLRLETEWAEFFESHGDYPSAGERWGKVADLRNIPRSEFLPGQRILWKMGDSMGAWRRLVYNGFAAIRSPEIAQGVLEMADKPNADLRARLLGALLALDLNNPSEECRRRLESVQAIAPNEITSHELLERMDARPFERSLNLPLELLAGHAPYYNPVTGVTEWGTIEDSGELRTIVVLNKGHYEMILTARGVPLSGQWPIIRIELDGAVIGHTQVNSKEDHVFPCTFNINAANAYSLRIVFENYHDAYEEGRMARRGLNISSVTFQCARE